MGRRALSVLGTLLAVLVVAAALLWGGGGDDSGGRASETSTSGPSASSGRDPVSGLPWIAAGDLPDEARETLALIDAGGPYPYPGKDGSTFRNEEGLLPSESRGYYAEYTVPTPGSTDRGARRIITGDGGEYYWTADHYAHFERVRR
jgi:ribonuclease T1